LQSFATGQNVATGALSKGGTQPVMTVSVDAFVERYHLAPVVLKIDVEGAEYDVLCGAGATLEGYRPAILLSVHGEAQRAACARLLESHGYHLAPLAPAEFLATTR
jgi:hypothetical protein